ncbi:hypothetical protein [Pseudomonas sp. 37 R 15]|jgi:hypothetical protein|nr:hypothetical protein [Pseudomonas sp. 37 R 15]
MSGLMILNGRRVNEGQTLPLHFQGQARGLTVPQSLPSHWA